MHAFCQLYEVLDASTRTLDKVGAMRQYFAEAAHQDAAWALYFLSGRRLKSLVRPKYLRAWASEVSGLPDWLIEASYEHVGDLAETLAKTLPLPEVSPEAASGSTEAPGALARFIETQVLPLADWPEATQGRLVKHAWSSLPPLPCFIYLKLLSGSLRVGVSRALVVRAVAEVAGLPPAEIDHRLSGQWQPQGAFFEELISPEGPRGGLGMRPYPFYLASPLEEAPQELGPLEHWQAEWKWDGIRAQLIRREGNPVLWSRGAEILSQGFPEILLPAQNLPKGIVLDGEVLCWEAGRPLPFARLQRRITRKKVSQQLLGDAPAVFLAYDLLEFDGQDWRQRPLSERCAALKRVVGQLAAERIQVAEPIHAASWEQLECLRAEARQRGVEGLMLKHRQSPYGSGRQRGHWWKWKVEPYQVDAVLTQAQAGHGRRSGLFTDYTFSVWDGPRLVPFAKAYSGLSDEEIRQVDHWVKRHTTGRHGPVRTVEPTHVFELHFEGIAQSQTHKSGIAVRFPRIHRWRKDKAPAQADTLERLKALLPDATLPSGQASGRREQTPQARQAYTQQTLF